MEEFKTSCLEKSAEYDLDTFDGDLNLLFTLANSLRLAALYAGEKFAWLFQLPYLLVLCKKYS